MDSLQARIVIVGAGQAGARAAEALRAAGHRGTITLVGEEEHLPYERPQLSKAILIDHAPSPAFIRGEREWDDLGVSVLTASRVVAADREKRAIGLADGRDVTFDRLLLTTGTRVRRLAELDDSPLPVRYLRGMGDALGLRDELQPGRRIVLVGGGVIGLEVASAAIARGCKVTVLERAATLLPQLGSKALSTYARELHASRGVEIVCGSSIEHMTAGGLQLRDGQLIAADMVVVGVGVEPVAELASQLGLDVRGGIRVDPTGRAADDIYAAGDVAEQWSRCHGRWMRIENWANAQNQAIATAKAMACGGTAYDAPSWFWSDQYDTNIQVVGNPAGENEIVRGDPLGGRFLTINIREGEVIGGIAVNSARDMAVLRRLVASRKTVRRDDLENPAFELKKTLAA